MDSKEYEANLRRVRAGLEEVWSATPTGVNRRRLGNVLELLEEALSDLFPARDKRLKGR